MSNKEIPSLENFEQYLAQFQPSASETLQSKIFKENRYPTNNVIRVIAATIIGVITLAYSLFLFSKNPSKPENILVEENFTIQKTSFVYMRFQLRKKGNISEIFSEDSNGKSFSSQEKISMLSIHK